MKRSTWFLFVAFCGLSSSVWLITPPEASTLQPIAQDGLAYLLAAIVAATTVRSRKPPLASIGALSSLSACLFAAPIILLDLVPHHVPSTTLVALFAFVPAVIAIVLETSRASGLLEPSLAGFAGALFLLPVELPESSSGWMGAAFVFGIVILVGVTSVWTYARFQALDEGDRRLGTVAVCLVNALVLLLYAVARNGIPAGRPSPSGLAIETASVLLLVVLVSSMPPVLLSTRFFVVPLLTAVSSYLLMRPELNLRIGLGALLLAGGVVFLLRWGNRKDNNSAALSLR